MKKRVFLFSLILSSGYAFSQSEAQLSTPKKGVNTPVNPVQGKVNNANSKSYGKYFIKEEKLKSYFVSGQIPHDFPQYNHALSFEENKEIAYKWAKIPQNFSLLNEEGKRKVMEYEEKESKK